MHSNLRDKEPGRMASTKYTKIPSRYTHNASASCEEMRRHSAPPGIVLRPQRRGGEISRLLREQGYPQVKEQWMVQTGAGIYCSRRRERPGVRGRRRYGDPSPPLEERTEAVELCLRQTHHRHSGCKRRRRRVGSADRASTSGLIAEDGSLLWR